MITSRPIVAILEILHAFLLVSLINSVTFLAPCDVAALYVAPANSPQITSWKMRSSLLGIFSPRRRQTEFSGVFLHENELELESNREASSSISKGADSVG